MSVPAVVGRSASAALAGRLAGAVLGEAILVDGPNLVPALQLAFRAERPLIAIVPTAIVIRALAPLIASKHDDPPVLSVTPDGRFIIPLLGLSHGATRLATTIEAWLGGTRVSSTATEAAFQAAIDDAPEGYVLRNHEHYKDFAVALLRREPVRIEGDAPWLASVPQAAGARLAITVTERDMAGSPEHLVFHCRTLAVGVGCERGTDPAEVSGLVADTLRANGLATEAVACFATIDLKEDEPAICRLGDSHPLRFFSAAELAREAPRITAPSELVRIETGTPSVAEAAALAAAGPGAELIVPKTKSRRATCAIARAPSVILDFAGRERGRLLIIGLGPGDRNKRSLEAQRELWAATDWVGYSLYLDLAADMRHGQMLHPFPLGEEEARARHAISLAGQGRRVALICSGDPGIYAMASLVCEIIEREPSRIAIEVIPGISAFQAAAAKAGAMIGHDFCCISLSDLLTPWDVIEKRIKAAAEADFVIAFYNPRSLKRRDQIERAMQILAPHRPPDTPVIIASNLGRPGEKVKIVPLSLFDPAEVDMLTLVLVGCSQSISFKRGDGQIYAYTPRGYASKRQAG